MSPHQAYLLAAGRGQRAGGPKAWKTHQGRPLLQTQVDFLVQDFAADHITVSIQAEWRERCGRLHAGVRWVAVDPSLQPLAALQQLLQVLPLRHWGFVHHVDMPVWHPALFRQLAAAIPEADRASATAIVPVRNGRGGHPILLAPRAHDDVMRLDPHRDRLDHWLRTRTVQRVDVEFDCVLENWNRIPDAGD